MNHTFHITIHHLIEVSKNVNTLEISFYLLIFIYRMILLMYEKRNNPEH
jgi:hypothetical protein